MELNERQKAAANDLSGNILVNAGAGTGKTRVMVERYKNLIKSGAKEEEILMVTYTRKVAEEMKKRIKKDIGLKGNENIGTIHNMCSKILKEYGDYVGVKPFFKILPENKYVIEDILKELSIEGIDPVNSTDKFKSAIGHLKGWLIDVDSLLNDSIVIDDVKQKFRISYVEALEDEPDTFMEHLKVVYKTYQEYLEASNSLDYDDLILKTNQLFNNHEPVVNELKQRIKFIQIDEFQDTDDAQLNIFKKLQNNNVFAVGDDFQLIFGFAGSKIENILEFEKIFPGAKIYALEENYRSAKKIIDISNESIGHNFFQRKEKTIIPTTDEDGNLEYYSDMTKYEELGHLQFMVRKLRNEGRRFDDFAVIVRNKYQAKDVADRLSVYYPVEIVGANKDDENELRHTIIRAIKFICNPTDFKNFADGYAVFDKRFRFKDMRELRRLHFKDKTGSMISDIVAKAFDAGTINTNYKVNFVGNINTKNVDDVINFIEKGLKLEEYIRRISFSDKLASRSVDLWEEIEVLFSEMRMFAAETHAFNIHGFEKWIEEREKNEIENTEANTLGKIKIFTYHRIKGLEFPIIFMPFLNQETFLRETDNLEDGRRLFYVGMTRAKESIYFSEHIEKTKHRTGKFLSKELIYLNEIGYKRDFPMPKDDDLLFD